MQIDELALFVLAIVIGLPFFIGYLGLVGSLIIAIKDTINGEPRDWL